MTQQGQWVCFGPHRKKRLAESYHLQTRLWMGPVRPQEQLEPLTETDNPDGNDAGEISAVKSKIQPVKPSDHEMATHEACGHYPCRDWCRACVGGFGRSDARKRRLEEQNSLPVASMDYRFFTDGDESDTRRATPFLVVKIKPSMMMWSMPVQCKGVEDQATPRAYCEIGQ